MFWEASHIDNGRGGLAILISNQFASRFQRGIEEVRPARGHIFGLRLAGAQGCLHVWNVHLDASNNPNIRCNQLHLLADLVTPPAQAHTAIAGEFNFTSAVWDRVSESLLETGLDRHECFVWEQRFAGFRERFRSDFKRDGGRNQPKSRIDKIFSNLHPTAYMGADLHVRLLFDRSTRAADTVAPLSDHRMVSARFTPCSPGPRRHARIPAWATRHDKWQ